MASKLSTEQFREILSKRKWVSEKQMEELLEEEALTHATLNTILLKRGWLNSEQVGQILAELYHMPFVRLRETKISREAIGRVPLKLALHFKVMPIEWKGSALTIALANPQDVRILDELRLALKQPVTIGPVVATEEDILLAMKKHYGVGAETIDQILAARGIRAALPEAMDEIVEDIEQLADDASVVKLVNQLILEAHRRRATDIHLEPYRGKVRLRYRVDGMLHDADVAPAIRQLFPAIVSRIKVISNLNLVERRLPQDGRASVKIGEEKLDLRISVLPASLGESVVIRILPNRMLLDLQEMGYREDDLKILRAAIQKPYGLVFVTGPTGSGKTTTLYACLKVMNTKERKIVTIEDPIEYELEGITQVNVNPQIGLSFANGLRSMLRHDPNVMMVGEVRDTETAELAVRIALTGHLVLSTLHTNDATGGITRLMDMGIDPYLIASSVECIIAQRLVRLLCSSCKEKVRSGRSDVEWLYKASGCEACHHSGFLGRTAIYEFFLMTQPIRELVVRKASADEIRRMAVEQGMQTMREDGWSKVKAGLTSLDEVLRVTQDER